MKELMSRAVVANADGVRQRESEMRAIHGRIGSLHPNGCDLPWEDYLSLSLALLEYKPNLVIELGRGVGTSTALFRYWNFPVVSLCNTTLWHDLSLPALQQIKSIDWSGGVVAIVEDIRKANYRALVNDAKRVLVFWDAHGIEIADAVFQRLLPSLAGKDVLVACHDMRDSRYFALDPANNWIQRGDIVSTFEQIDPIVDFCIARGLEFYSPTHQLMTDARDLWPHPWPYCYWHYFCPE